MAFPIDIYCKNDKPLLCNSPHVNDAHERKAVQHLHTIQTVEDRRRGGSNTSDESVSRFSGNDYLSAVYKQLFILNGNALTTNAERLFLFEVIH